MVVPGTADCKKRKMDESLAHNPFVDLGVLTGVNATRSALNQKVVAGVGYERVPCPGNQLGKKPRFAHVRPAAGLRVVISTTRNRKLPKGTTLVITKTQSRTFGSFGAGWVLQCSVADNGSAGKQHVLILLEQSWRQTVHGTAFHYRSENEPVSKCSWPDLGKDWHEALRVHTQACRGKKEVQAMTEEISTAYLAKWKRQPGTDAVANRLALRFLSMSDSDPLYKNLCPIAINTLGVELDLGFTTTVHSAQGSEFARCIILAECIDFICKTGDARSNDVYKWSYTAMTRAKQSLFVVVYH